MWSVIIGFLGLGWKVVKSFWPSSDEKLGQTETELKAAKKVIEDVKRADRSRANPTKRVRKFDRS